MTGGTPFEMAWPRVARVLIVLWLASGSFWQTPAAAAEEPSEALAAEAVDFETSIRPVFAAKCQHCHGAGTQEGGLALNTRKGAVAGGNSGPLFVPGKRDESRVWRVLSGLDPETKMPPEGEEPLTPDELKLLGVWLDQGAAWPEDPADQRLHDPRLSHWSWQPLTPGVPPPVHDRGWGRGPIDDYVLAELEARQISPSIAAPKDTLIRRVYLDLLGLPPAQSEVAAFMVDQEPDAYERMVDRVLHSPRFGERFGRHWLDQARYADSDGYEKDTTRPFAWRYRDWVIAAINQDLPLDAFTIQQLAGDLLPGADLNALVATGFHRNTLLNREGGIDPEEDRVKRTVDRANTTGTVWLGLTVGCAQCHEHKYDPISQREYYGLYAFFNSLEEPDIAAPLPHEAADFAAKWAAYEAEHARLVQAADQFDQNAFAKRQRAWEASLDLSTRLTWQVQTPTQASSAQGATLQMQADQSVLVTGANPETDVYTVQFSLPAGRWTGLRLETLPHDALPARGPGRVAHGNFVLNELACGIHQPDGTVQALPLVNAKADYSQGQFDVAKCIDGDPETGWAVAPQFGLPHAATMEFAAPLQVAETSTLTVTLTQAFGQQHTLGCFRLSLTNAETPWADKQLPENVWAALAVSPDSRTAEQQAALTQYYRSVDAEVAALDQAVHEHGKSRPAEPETRAQALRELPAPRETHILIRGDFLRPGAAVVPATPALLPAITPRGAQADRLDLARWLADVQNPLVPRVLANRIWQHLWGAGLQRTPEDFGLRGELPTHPRLLDYAAQSLVAHGYSRKWLARQILVSSAYRQSAAARPDLDETDPENSLLARQNRLRLEAEIIRDVALSASGLLTNTLGGPSVRPPQPEGIAELTYQGSASWQASTGAERYRRGLYIHFQRTSPFPMLMTFDSPDSNVCIVRRERTNSPLQALTLLNDEVFVECAQALAARLMAEIPAEDTDSLATAETKLQLRIRRLVQIALGREPNPAEAAALTHLFQQSQQELAAQPDTARLAGLQPEEDVAAHAATLADFAAYTVLARVVMNVDEFVCRE